MNEPLKADQLKVGREYTCRLSGRQVLITAKETTEAGRLVVSALVYNQVTGMYNLFEPQDYLLYEP